MSKQLYSGRYILKINSSRLKMKNWNLDISFDEARRNEEIITLGDGQLLRFIREINNNNITEEEIRTIKNNIKKLKKEPNTKGNRNNIVSECYKLNNILYIKDYIAVVFENKSDFDRATSKKGFYINKVKYKRLIGTTGGIKNNTIMFCAESIYDELNKKLENDRNVDVPLVPAKFEAYKSLSASVSTPVSKPKGVLIIKDPSRIIKDKVISVTNNGMGGFKVEHNVDYESEKEFCDGCCMISPSLSKQWAIDLGLYYTNKAGENIPQYIPSGFNTRFSYEKGMVGTFDFHKFSRDVAKNNIVIDAWGNEIDINTVDLVLTTNMVKLWNAYESIDDYLSKSYNNGYEWCVTKVCPKNLEDIRNTNYQYLQSFDMSDEDIHEFIKPTVDGIKDVLGGDINKTILFSKGVHINDKNISESDFDYIRALMIEPKVMHDPYVKQCVYRMIEKRIKDAKKGVLKIKGNYSIIFNDLYALCEAMFGLEPKGLLQNGEFYSKYWNDKNVKEVLAFRSPMTSHNNIRKLKFVNNEKVNEWFKYMKTVVIFNSYDTTCEALNGADFDSDSIITTNNEVLLRNYRSCQTIVCEQNPVPKTKVTEESIIKTNKNGFGDAIGTDTNRVTSMFEVLSSLKYKLNKNPSDKTLHELIDEIESRIIQGQAYQQESIDKIKGIIAKKMPKSWYDYKTNKIHYEDVYDSLGNIKFYADDKETMARKQKDIQLMVNKKPYFFIYNYEHLMTQYKTFIKNTSNNCLIRYGVTIEELKNKLNKSNDEEKFLTNLVYKSPVFDCPSVMNRICHTLEDCFKDVKLKVKEDNFDCSLLKTDKHYSKGLSKEIVAIFNNLKSNIKQNQCRLNCNDGKESLINKCRQDMFNKCSNEEDICNILIDMVYKHKSNRYVVWMICGEQIINNLLKKNNYSYKYPIPDINGDIEYNETKYKVVEFKTMEDGE